MHLSAGGGGTRGTTLLGFGQAPAALSEPLYGVARRFSPLPFTITLRLHLPVHARSSIGLFSDRTSRSWRRPRKPDVF